MTYLVSAFSGEGPSDARFLEPLLLRLLQDCLREAHALVEVQTPFVLLRPRSPRVEDVIAAVQAERANIDLLFLHADGKGQPEEALRRHIDPIGKSLASGAAGGPRCVAVVPVHETEAWALADGDALRDVLGTNRTDEDLRLPPLAEIERLPDPKSVLDAICARARGRQGLSRPPAPFAALGERVGLPALRRLVAFRRTETELRAALRHLGCLR